VKERQEDLTKRIESLEEFQLDIKTRLKEN